MNMSLGTLMVLATWLCVPVASSPQSLRGSPGASLGDAQELDRDLAGVADTSTTSTTTTETEEWDVNEHMLAPEVDYMKKSAQFRIYPNGRLWDDSTWARLRFTRIWEVDSEGNPVSGRIINSLAGQKDIVWEQGNETIGGAEALVTSINLTLSFGGNFVETCPSSSRRLWARSGPGRGTFSRRRRRDDDDEEEESDSSSSLSGGPEPMSVAIKVMVFYEAATVFYGNQTFDVSPSQLKFNIESENWPFCDESHSLQVVMNIKTAFDASDDEDSDEVEEGDYQNDVEETSDRRLGRSTNRAYYRSRRGYGRSNSEWKRAQEERAELSNQYLSSSASTIFDENITMDFPQVVLIDDVETECDVEVTNAVGYASSNVIFTFPYFTDSLVYDPLVEYSGFVFISATTTTQTTTTTEGPTQTSTVSTVLSTTTELLEPTTTTEEEEVEGTILTTTEEEEEEEVADSHLLAPEVDFLGKSAKFKIFPHGKLGKNGSWVKLTFKKIQEIDSSGSKVKGRVINSLSGQRNLVWGQANQTVGGASALVTTMNLTLNFGGNFKETCSDRRMLGSFSRRRRRKNNDDDDDEDGDKEEDTMMITIRVIMFQETATISYANETFDVSPSQLKFNIESEKWPFCDESNSLEFTMTVMTPDSTEEDDDEEGDYQHDVEEDDDDDDRRLGRQSSWKSRTEGRGRLNNRYLAYRAGDAGMLMDMPEVALIDDVASNCSVETTTKGATSTVVFTFPFFSETLVYDPTLEFETDETTTTAEMVTTTADESSAASTSLASTAETSTAVEMLVASTTVGEEEATTTEKRKKRFVRGGFSLRLGQGMSGRDFCSNSHVRSSLRSTMAGRCGVKSSRVSVGMAVKSRRLEAEEPEFLIESIRRLEDESVSVTYSISLPDDEEEVDTTNTGDVGSDEIVEAINTLDSDELTTLVQEDLSEAGLNVTVAVSSIDETAQVLEVEVDDETTSTTSTTTTSSSSEDGSDKKDPDSALGFSMPKLLYGLVFALCFARAASAR